MANKLMFKTPTEEEKALIRQRLGTSEEDIGQAVLALRSWLETQPHLPHVIDDARLERMYIACKCSIQKTKKTLDAYYTLKNKFPELLMNRDPLECDVEDIVKQAIILTIPNLTEDCHRVSCLMSICPDADKLNVAQVMKVILMAVEMFLLIDYSVGFIFFVDLKNVTAAHLTKITLRDVRTLETVGRTAYSKRAIALHFVNAPKIIDMVLSLVYPAIPAKLRNRVYTHLPGSETLFKHVPKTHLPNELGGTAGPANELMGAVYNSMCTLREWFLEQDKYVADESKRPPDNSYQYELFGVDGSFKKLQVD